MKRALSSISHKYNRVSVVTFIYHTSPIYKRSFQINKKYLYLYINKHNSLYKYTQVIYNIDTSWQQTNSNIKIRTCR